MYREVIINLITGTPPGGTIEVLEPCDGKLSRTVLRGEGSRKAPALPGPPKKIDTNCLKGYLLDRLAGKIIITIRVSL